MQEDNINMLCLNWCNSSVVAGNTPKLIALFCCCFTLKQALEMSFTVNFISRNFSTGKKIYFKDCEMYIRTYDIFVAISTRVLLPLFSPLFVKRISQICFNGFFEIFRDEGK